MNPTNPHLKQPAGERPIVATLVTDEDQRLLCLPRIAGRRCVMLEHTIFNALGRICPAYSGGYWRFYTLSNSGFYMAPESDTMFSLSCDNDFQGEVSPGTAGLIATATAYSHLSFLNDGDCFASAYHLLSEFIFQLPEAGVIRAALD